MSVSENSRTTPSVQPAASASGIANPAPLGLAAFALTTFLLSAANANWMTAATGNAWLGYALAYGGLCQLLAGMWEFRTGNTFGATAFSSYGGFWIGLGIWAIRVAPTAAGNAGAHDVGWILLAFAIFNTYMMVLAAQVSIAVFGVFLTLELTEIVLFIGNFAVSPTTIHIGGYLGVITALVAWYTSAAGLAASQAGGRVQLPVGKPLLR